MASRRYLNFDLLLEQEGEGRYQARVTDSPLGETPSVRFQLPFDATTLANLLLKLDPGRSAPRVEATGRQQAARDFGGPLYQAVFTGDLALAWHRSLDRVRAEQAGGLRLRLRLSDAPAIVGLPWELLYDARTNNFLAQSERTPVVRFLDVPQVPRPMVVDGPLRVLAIISSPVDLEVLDVEAEWRRIGDALAPRVQAGLVVVDRLPSATVADLGAWLRQHETHVVHFVGHGDFDDRLREVVIYFQDERGRSVPVTSSFLGPYVRDHDPLRMVVLNACRSARADTVDRFGGMAQGLVQQDATAVVAMQFPISDRAAVTFTGELYGALVDGFPVDQAVSSARKALLADFRDEWFTPVLFLSSPDGNIFETVHAAAGVLAESPADAEPVPDDLAGPMPKSPAAPEPFPDAAVRRGDRLRQALTKWVRTLQRSQRSQRHAPADVVVGSTEEDRRAFARLDVDGRGRPDVVVVDQPFQVTLGLRQRKDRVLVSSAAVSFAAGEAVELEAVLLHDPTSIEVTGSPRATLLVTDAQPYPAVTITCTARYGEELSPQRRLGMQLLRGGQVVAVAWRTVVAVDTAAEVAVALAPSRRDVALLDLDPLVGDQPPDVVLSVCQADAGPTTYVWSAYAADPAIPVPDLPSTSTLEPDVEEFATQTRRSIQFSADPAKDFLGLSGRALRIGRAIPQGVQDALRAVIEAPGRIVAPAVLLLTEELTVPWELAAFDPPLTSRWGGSSPFLGAHAAVSRWPLTEHKPSPRPRSSVMVRSGAVLTADYTGVAGWGRLESAVHEAAHVATLFDPPATAVTPELWTVVDLFRGRPPCDVLHVALHGQFDAKGDQEGIVLLARSPAGGATAQFLTPAELENGALDHGPFVFLNACQVGADQRVLGDYGGFASTLLRIGATGVLAPLWNVKDDVAADFARRFYDATLGGPDPTPVAEAVRAVRATYTEQGVRDGAPGLHATLVAYQVFGHPRLRLTRATT